MQSNRGRDTQPEVALRSILHRSGLRYRVDHPLPFNRRRRADIALTRAGLYVFLDGCFWHGCPDHFVVPKTRTEFWVEKINANRIRDADTDARLTELGLSVMRIWEHVDPVLAAAAVKAHYEHAVNNSSSASHQAGLHRDRLTPDL